MGVHRGIGIPSSGWTDPREWVFGLMAVWTTDMKGLALVLGKFMVLVGRWEDEC